MNIDRCKNYVFDHSINIDLRKPKEDSYKTPHVTAMERNSTVSVNNETFTIISTVFKSLLACLIHKREL